MNTHEILKTYAMFYVSENDDFDMTKKLDMLQFIEQADEMMLTDLFENGEIESPEDLLETHTEEKDTATLLGESMIMIAEADEMLSLSEIDVDMAKNRLKDMLGMQTSLKYKLTKATGKAKEAIQNQLDTLGDKIGDLKGSIAKGAEKAVEKGKEMAGAAGEKIAKGAGAAAETGKELAGQAGEKIAGAAGKAAEFAQQQPGMIGAAVAAAAALAAGVVAYRKFFGKAAQACKTAPDKAACMSQYKMKAKQAQIAAINAGKAKCAKVKDPDKCKAKIDAKISSLKAKMQG